MNSRRFAGYSWCLHTHTHTHTHHRRRIFTSRGCTRSKYIMMSLHDSVLLFALYSFSCALLTLLSLSLSSLYVSLFLSFSFSFSSSENRGGNEPSALASDKRNPTSCFRTRDELVLSHAKACGLYLPNIS